MPQVAAFQKGAQAAHRCRRAEGRGVILGAQNPYRAVEKRAAWAQGFNAAYYGA